MNKRNGLKALSHMALCCALICVCSLICIPLPTVPITLQSFAVCTTAALLGPKKGTAAILLYIALGAVGLPVFSGLSGGIGALMGAGGGFILGFIPLSLLCGALSSRVKSSIPALSAAMAAGTALCYICGLCWFCLIYSPGASLYAAVSACVLPFILPDALKIFLSATVVSRLQGIIKI